MPAGPTYFPIATQVVTSNTQTIDFTSIPATYTDLILMGDVVSTANNMLEINMRFNNDSTTNYFMAGLRQNNVSAPATMNVNSNVANVSYFTAPTTVRGQSFYGSIYQYRNNRVKNYQMRAIQNNTAAGSRGSEFLHGYWNNTAAINRITFSLAASGQFAAGTSISIYGIEAA